MPEYIDKEKLIRDLIDNRSFYPAIVKNAIENAPIEDVVPRSDIEKIFEEIEEARERWEAIYSNDHFGYGGGAYGYLETDVDHTIYDLKNKYIGE